MRTSANDRRQQDRQAPEEKGQDLQQNASATNDAVEDDGSPVLDEIDLEETGLSEEEADNIEWDDAR